MSLNTWGQPCKKNADSEVHKRGEEEFAGMVEWMEMSDIKIYS